MEHISFMNIQCGVCVYDFSLAYNYFLQSVVESLKSNAFLCLNQEAQELKKRCMLCSLIRHKDRQQCDSDNR